MYGISRIVKKMDSSVKKVDTLGICNNLYFVVY